MNGISWVARVICRSFLISPSKPRRFWSLPTVNMSMKLGLRLVKSLPTRAGVFDDGYRHACNKLARTPAPGLDCDFYLSF